MTYNVFSGTLNLTQPGTVCNLGGMGGQTPGPLGSCGRGVHSAYALWNETAEAKHYKRGNKVPPTQYTPAFGRVTHHPFTD